MDSSCEFAGELSGGTQFSSRESDGDVVILPAAFSGKVLVGVEFCVSEGGTEAMDFPDFPASVGDGFALDLPLVLFGGSGGDDSALLVLRRLREEDRRWINEIESLAFSMSLSRPRF